VRQYQRCFHQNYVQSLQKGTWKDNSLWGSTDKRCRTSCRCIDMYKSTYAFKGSFGKMVDSCAAVILTRRESTVECLLGWFDGDEAMANRKLRSAFPASLRTCPSLPKLLVQPHDTIAKRYCRSCPTVQNIRYRIAIATISRNEAQVRGYFRCGGLRLGACLHEAVFEPGHTHNSR
jgi:hypothetical protein